MVVVHRERERGGERETELELHCEGRESLQMVFKRRQKATARTEREEEEERAAVSARSSTRQLRSSLKTKQLYRKAKNIPADRTGRLVCVRVIPSWRREIVFRFDSCLRRVSSV